MAINPFDQRTLIAAVNDPSFETPKQFLLSNFFGNPIATESDNFDILYSTNADRGLASFRASGAPGRVVRFSESDTIRNYKFPIIREKIPITAADLLRLQNTMQIYRANPMSLAERQQEVEAKYMKKLKERVQRREEWMAAQILMTGKVRYAGEDCAFEYDFQVDSQYLPVLSGTNVWGGSTANIFENLQDWTTLINEATGGYGGRVIVVKDVANVLLQDEAIMKQLNNLNYQAGRLVLDANTNTIGNYGGFTFERYAETYKSDAGSTESYFPANGVLLMGSTFVGRRLFGLHEELVEGRAAADPYFIKVSEPDFDPSGKWMLISSRPAPVPERAGSWVFATVL